MDCAYRTVGIILSWLKALSIDRLTLTSSGWGLQKSIERSLSNFRIEIIYHVQIDGWKQQICLLNRKIKVDQFVSGWQISSGRRGQRVESGVEYLLNKMLKYMKVMPDGLT